MMRTFHGHWGQVMSEFFVRLDVYLHAATLDAAVEKAMDALTGVANETYLVEAMVNQPDDVKESA